MAISVRVYQPSDAVLAKMAGLIEMQSEWRIIRVDSFRRVVMPNLDRSRVYMVAVDGSACSCRCGQHGGMCAHRLAAASVAAEAALAASAAEADPGLATDAEIDVVASGIYADARGRDEARKRVMDAMFDDGIEAMDRAIAKQREATGGFGRALVPGLQIADEVS